MGLDYIRAQTGKPWRKRWNGGLDRLKAPTLLDLTMSEAVKRPRKGALTQFRCRRVDGSRLRPLEILPCLAACIRVPSFHAASSSITSRPVPA